MQTAGSAALVIGACLLLVGWVDDVSAHGERFVQVLFGAGAMTLSLYTLHVLMRTELVPPARSRRRTSVHVVVVLAVGACSPRWAAAARSRSWSASCPARSAAGSAVVVVEEVALATWSSRR